ncbi:MAG: radical SAM protein, partial [Planctomycetes bacterium]|nr:radical SAM protein [Planctomycetota bacterium]
ALCDAIAEAGLNDLGYIVQAECKGVSTGPELARKMDRANFRIVQLGIENVSPRNLEMMRKGRLNVLDNIKRSIQYLHDNNIMIVGGMIVGNPDDNEEDIATNYKFFDDQDIDFFGDQIMTPYPKTGIREEMMRQGLVTNLEDYRLYNGYWANVRTRHLTPDEIQFLRWKYRDKVSTFRKTTKAFRANHPIVDLYRRVWLRPYRRVKYAILNRGKSERQLYEEAMDRDMALNDFFNDPEYPKSWRRSVQDVELPSLPALNEDTPTVDSTSHAR